MHGFNRYAYANNNPYKYTDPDGNLPVLVPLVIFVAKELASEAVEQATGVPMPTVKNAGKAILKQAAKRSGRSGKQKRLREMMNDPKVGKADRGWLKNDDRHVKTGNKSGLRLPRNGRKSPGRKNSDKGYELAHPHDKPASKGNGYEGSKLKNHADHKVETKLHRKRY